MSPIVRKKKDKYSYFMFDQFVKYLSLEQFIYCNFKNLQLRIVIKESRVVLKDDPEANSKEFKTVIKKNCLNFNPFCIFTVLLVSITYLLDQGF